MTAQTPPIFLQAGSHPAEDVRRALYAVHGGRQGIYTAGALAVSEKSGTPNMSVDVAEGQVAVNGSESAYAGVYLCEARGTTNLAISAADATNPRLDLIVARVRDAAYSGATNTFSLEVVTGTPAGVPADPSLPSGSCFVLARVTVDASASSITNANIADLRLSYSTAQNGRAAAVGGTVVCTNATRPTGVEGLKIYETDTDYEYTYSGSTWVPTASLGVWPTWAPTLVQSGTVTKTVSVAEYEKIGRRCTGNALMVVTGSGTSGQPIVVGLPVAMASSGNLVIGSGWVYDASAVAGYAGALIRVSSTAAILWAHGETNNIGADPAFGLASPDQISYQFSYQTAS